MIRQLISKGPIACRTTLAVVVALTGLGCGDDPSAAPPSTPVFEAGAGEPATQPKPGAVNDTAADATDPGGDSPSVTPSSNEGVPAVQGPPAASGDGAAAGSAADDGTEDTAGEMPDGTAPDAPTDTIPPAGEPPVSEPPENPAFPPSAGKPTVYLAGDSTVQTYGAAQAPQQGWGQRIQEFFSDDVVFVNRSIGGRSSKSFIDEGRLDGIVADLQRGDYLFAQWGINDRYRSDPARFTDPSTTFKQYLRMYIDGARSKDAIPVLVTPTPRLDFSNGAFQNGFTEYCAAIQELGAETNTTVIDLQTRGLAFYTSIGLEEVEDSIALDVLHFKVEGAFHMARLVSEGVQESVLPIGLFVE
jgi:lysophospholipase L1-like esterase